MPPVPSRRPETRERHGVFTGDCLPLMREWAESGLRAELVFADPPFNIGYDYDVYDDRRPRDEYLAWTREWVGAAARLLTESGSLWVAIGDAYAAEVKLALDAAGLTMRNWVVWAYTFGVHLSTKFGRDHTHLLYFVKDAARCTFNADAVRVPSGRQAYGDRRADPRGRVPGDVWNFPRVAGTFKERNGSGHNCQMPEAVLERIVLACSGAGDLVVDPFGGTGTTAAVAKRLGRSWKTVELSPDYAAAAAARVAGVVGPDDELRVAKKVSVGSTC